MSAHTLWLWIGFKFVSLTYQKQSIFFIFFTTYRCELVSNLYLWRIRNNKFRATKATLSLWIGFKFVSLTYQKQSCFVYATKIMRCELVSNLYLWRIRNNSAWHSQNLQRVVNWFQICIFDVSETIDRLLRSLFT